MKQITIATYNILHGAYAELDWSRIAAVVRESGADIVGFQEIDMYTNRANGADTVTGLAQAMGFPNALFVPTMDFDGGRYGTAILSRYPFKVSEVYPLPSAHYEPRSFGYVTVTLDDGTPFAFLNTHLSYESEEQQDIQMKALADWMQGNIPADIPTVLTGDFNTEDFTAFTPVKALGYALVNDTDHEYKTFRAPPLAIDNIVYRKDALTPADHGMIEKDTSDHNLLWCRFSFQ